MHLFSFHSAAAATPVTNYNGLQAAINAAPTGGAITVAAGQNIVLTSAAGSIFTFTQANTGIRHFSVAGSLTLQNVMLSGPGGGTAAIAGGVDVSGGTLTMGSGGAITNCRAPGKQ